MSWRGTAAFAPRCRTCTSARLTRRRPSSYSIKPEARRDLRNDPAGIRTPFRQLKLNMRPRSPFCEFALLDAALVERVSVSEIVLRTLIQGRVNALHSRNQPVFSIGVTMHRWIALFAISLFGCGKGAQRSSMRAASGENARAGSSAFSRNMAVVVANR